MNHHNESLEKLWEELRGNPIIKGLKKNKKISELVGSLESFNKVFESPSRILGCSDGRICEHRLGGAGDFILASEEEREKFISENKGKIEVVTSHDGCGAAGIKFKAMQDAGEALPDGIATADELGVYYAKKLAEELGAEYRHIGANEMTGDVHNETVVYLDGTGKINPGALKEMPAGFISSGPKLGFSDEYCNEELSILIERIAFSHHGFGNKFTKENPFYIIVSARDEEELTKLKKVAESVAEKFDGRVVVDGFIVKSEK